MTSTRKTEVVSIAAFRIFRTFMIADSLARFGGIIGNIFTTVDTSARKVTPQTWRNGQLVLLARNIQDMYSPMGCITSA